MKLLDTSIADALIDGYVDAREGRYRNPFQVGSDCYRAYEQSWNQEATQTAVRVRIAGGEPIHAIEESLDADEPQPDWRVRAWAFYRWLLGI
jgi:hypothetical protein